MQRSIAGWRSDEQGDWVALLDCGHRQHVRHRPPFFDRPWVEQAAGRAARLGTPLDCPLCDRAELPEGLTPTRSTPVWDQTTVPPALLGEHRTARDTWALLVVDDGRVDFNAPELAASGRPATVPVEPGRPQPIPPGVPHGVAPSGPARFHLEFFRVPRAPEPEAEAEAGELRPGAGSAPDVRPS
jgi:tellurite resistance-related uncharacterized protein